jgi:hypothetical protein
MSSLNLGNASPTLTSRMQAEWTFPFFNFGHR